MRIAAATAGRLPARMAFLHPSKLQGKVPHVLDHLFLNIPIYVSPIVRKRCRWTIERLCSPPEGFAMGVLGYCLLLLLPYIGISTFLSYRKLSHFKGPPLAAFSSSWLFWQSWTARLNVAEYDAIQKYGWFVP